MRGRFLSWNLYPPSNTTRFTFEALAFLLPFLKLAKVGKAGEFAKAGNLGKMIDPAPFLKPKINPSALGGHLFPRNYDPLGGLTPGKFLKKYWDPDKVNRDGERGGWKYPPDDGFDLSPGVLPPRVVTDMPVEFEFDRFGGPKGDYVSPKGTSFPGRALPPQSAEFDYHLYRLVKAFDKESGFPVEGTVARSFEKPGGGTQIKLPQAIKWLLEHDYIEESVFK